MSTITNQCLDEITAELKRIADFLESKEVKDLLYRLNNPMIEIK